MQDSALELGMFILTIASALAGAIVIMGMAVIYLIKQYNAETTIKDSDAIIDLKKRG